MSKSGVSRNDNNGTPLSQNIQTQTPQKIHFHHATQYGKPSPENKTKKVQPSKLNHDDGSYIDLLAKTATMNMGFM